MTANAKEIANVAVGNGDGTTDAYPHLPRMLEEDGISAPACPETLAAMGVNPDVLFDLALKLGNTLPSFTTEWAATELCLPTQIVEEMYWKLKDEKLVEVLGQQGPFSHKYGITARGREQAYNLMQFSGYIGPAPVSLEAYAAMLEWQSAQRAPIEFDDVQQAISSLVLPPDAVRVAALAASSGRSLFLFGPPGNGKTSVGNQLHRVIDGDLWIPHSLVAGAGSVIRLYDPQCHHVVEEDGDRTARLRFDRRWLRIQRPFVVAGGEMTMDELDLAYSPSLRFYEAPPHLKANGGTFLIDDFGRQRIEPHDLLNRWIIPLEHRIDHFTLQTGHKIQLPFLLMLIVATNLTVSEVADPAFLRRMGYRLHIDRPDAEAYRKIFQRYAAQFEIESDSSLLDWLLQRYAEESRELRASEPRDLIERARDVCRLEGKPLRLDREVMEIAWTGYFGNM